MTDWVREAAEEIWGGIFSVANAVAIIEKHCPFKKDTAYQEVVLKVSMDRALTVEEFRAEVNDKLGVVFHGCRGFPLERAIHRQQCEDFLVERYIELYALVTK